MLKTRIIPCLDVRDGRTTKGIKFQNNVDIGDPVAMARDVALLTEHGYRHRATEVLDLFPQTPHVEAVTVLER